LAETWEATQCTPNYLCCCPFIDLFHPLETCVRATCSTSSQLLLAPRRFLSTIIAWPRIAGIADFGLPIFPTWRADGHWKELPHHFSIGIVNQQLKLLFSMTFPPS
jgi:hypothetical protein